MNQGARPEGIFGEDTNVGDLLHGGVAQGLVTLVDSDPEGTLVDGTGNSRHRAGSVSAGGTLLHPLSSDLQLGLAEVGDHPLAIDAEELGNLLAVGGVLDLSLLFLADGHFAVIHYAATVSYNLTGWLEKNKDPLNDTIVELIKNGGISLAIQCFKDHPGQPLEAPKDQDRKKGKGGKTVSSYFKGQLDDLMTTLYKTK